MKHNVLLDTSFFIRLSQADLDKLITYFITSDIRSKNTFSALKKRIIPKFELIDISRPYHETFGILDLQ